MYKIVRMYFNGGKRTLKTGVTLAEAQAHCHSPEASSKTATASHLKQLTKRRGPWFDGYDECRK